MKLPFSKKTIEQVQKGIKDLQPEPDIKVPTIKTMDAKDFVAPSSIQIKPNSLQIGERYAKTFFIFSYPRYITVGWFSPIINLDVPMDISFFIHPADTTKVLKQLRQRITATQVEMMERQEKGLIRAPELEFAYQNMEDLRNRLQTATEKMFKFGLYLTVYADKEDEMRKIETTLRSILEGRLIFIKPAIYQQKEGFISTSPYCMDNLLVHTPMNTSPLSSVFPFVSFDLSSNEGILYGINQHNSSLVLFDRFKLDSFNEVVFGVSGSGKSVVGSEPVLIRQNGKTKLTKIGPLIEKLIEKYGATPIDHELEGIIDPGLEVFSFNKNLKTEWSKVTVAARKDAPNSYYKFITKAGREITTTGDHNMMVLRNGQVMVVKSTNVKKGEHIPLPRNISKEKTSLKEFNLLDLLKDSKNIYISQAEEIIKNNYQELKRANLDQKLDKYLYKYKDGRKISIQYFWKILNYLEIKSDSSRLKNVGISNKGSKLILPITFNIAPEFLTILGLISAEGTIKEEVVKISNTDKEVLDKMRKCLIKLGLPFFYTYKKNRKQPKGIDIPSRLFAQIIKALDGKQKAGNKKVLPFVFDLDKENISQYLSAYFEGDGGLEKERSTISASSKSKRLISEIAYLLYYFGIVSRIRKTYKKPTNSNWKRRKAYWTLSIFGQDNLSKFKNNINFISSRKKDSLEKTTQRNSHSNVDVIPETNLIFQEIYDLFGFQLYDIGRTMARWRNQKNNPPRKELGKIIETIENKVNEFKELKNSLEILNKLPELETIISSGENSQKLNSKLWNSLGSSWYSMKQKRSSFSENALTAIEVVNQQAFSLPELKQKIHFGFKVMNLPIKYQGGSLQNALIQNKQGNTLYSTIHDSAHFVWQNYQRILNENIPQVEARLEQLKILANSDLFWDPVASIQKIENKKDKYVYDLTVNNEVFLAGNGGMFVHNSYMVKLEVLRSLMTKTNVIILDPENEYEFLTDTVGGSFLNLSLTSDHHINPFDLPEPREDEKPADVLRSNIINLVGLMRIMLGGLTAEEDAIMDRAIAETYKARDINDESDPATWKENTPVMSDLESVLETMDGAESLVRRIRKFTTGTYASFFNQKSNISLKKKMVVFGIRDMEEELKQMAMFIIMRYIWKEITSELKKRILIVDEAWWLMQSEDGASFLYGLAKRARKYWLGVTTITQDVNDFMKSDYGQPIIANSAIQVLMKQSSATIDIVQKTFNLTEEEKMRLLEASIGEGLFFAGTKHVVISVVASYAEDQIITTAPEEVVKIKKAKKALEGI